MAESPIQEAEKDRQESFLPLGGHEYRLEGAGGRGAGVLMLVHPSNLVANRYELLSRLGEGGMGVVDAAYDRLTGSRVALKRVPLAPGAATTAAGAPTPPHDSTNRRKVREALATEFHTLAALRHPNIISVLDYGFDREQTPFFTMELLTAPRTLVAAGVGLPLGEQIELVAQLLRALAYLHRHHIVHRDLKPSNADPESGGPANRPRAPYFLPRRRTDGAGRGA